MKAIRVWKTHRPAGLCLLTFFALALVFPLSVRASDTSPGGEIFHGKCSICHGADATGNTPIGKQLKIPDLHSPQTKKLSDAQLVEIVTKGKGKMPAFKGKLSGKQIHELVVYLRELAKK